MSYMQDTTTNFFRTSATQESFDYTKKKSLSLQYLNGHQFASFASRPTILNRVRRMVSTTEQLTSTHNLNPRSYKAPEATTNLQSSTSSLSYSNAASLHC